MKVYLLMIEELDSEGYSWMQVHSAYTTHDAAKKAGQEAVNNYTPSHPEFEVWDMEVQEEKCI